MKKTHYETKILSLLSSFSRRRESRGDKASFNSGSSIGSRMTSRGDERGRSMVEMLGVLAIVGVISIGGIAGYNYGMTRYRTNEVLDGANKRAYTISTQETLGIKPYNLSEFKDSDVTRGGTFASTVQDWDGEFGLTITGVSKDICEKLVRMIDDKTALRAITKTSDKNTDLGKGDCHPDTNDLYLVFNKSMLPKDSMNSSRHNSEVSSISDGSSGSSTGDNPYIPSYCESHSDECKTVTIDDNIYTVIGNEDKTHDDAISACGGEDHMVTPADLGCTTIRSSECTVQMDGVYWLGGFDEAKITAQIASDQGYSSTQAYIDKWGATEISEMVSERAFNYNYGYLDFDLDSTHYNALCK